MSDSVCEMLPTSSWSSSVVDNDEDDRQFSFRTTKMLCDLPSYKTLMAVVTPTTSLGTTSSYGVAMDEDETGCLHAEFFVPPEAETMRHEIEDVCMAPPVVTPTEVLPPFPSPLRQHLELDDGVQVTQFPRIIGHRGSLYEYLENTLEGILACVDHGCHAVEFDVYRLVDDTLIVFHAGGTNVDPGDLSKYCVDTLGHNILTYTYPQAMALQFNTEFAEFPCPPDRIRSARIPTLHEVLTALKPLDIDIKIELKHAGTEEPVLQMVEQFNLLHRVSFSSFQHERVRTVRRLRPDRTRYRTAALYNREVPDDFIAHCRDLGVNEIHLKYDFCSRSRIQAIHRAGFGSMAWIRGPIGLLEDTTFKYNDVGMEDVAFYQALVDTGVQQICGNRLGLLMQMRREAEKAAVAM
jgi:glycerophosphoryl diester phosphodiesterase